MNTFGTRFRLTTFGESHGPAIGGVVDGMPPGVAISIEAIQESLDKRRPGQPATSQRRESDRLEILSGIYNGVTLGTPIGFIIRNTDCRPADYDPDIYRPGHADFTTEARYGLRDPRGGGRASARETACRVVGGALAEAVLSRLGISISAWIAAIGDFEPVTAPSANSNTLDDNSYSPEGEVPPERLEMIIEQARANNETLGGIVAVKVTGLPPGIGSPTYAKLSARLAEAMMGINAAKGFEIGMGFRGAHMPGSQVVDPFIPLSHGNGVATSANNSGGIQGGISNGMPLTMRVAFKPIATMPGRPLPTVNRQLSPTTFTARGRHDVSALPRAVPVVRAMAAMTVLDMIMDSRAQNIFGPETFI